MKRILFVMAAACAVLFGAKVNGWLDLPVMATPSSPGAGFARLYIDAGTSQLGCVTAAGASCMPAAGGGTASPITIAGNAIGSQIAASGAGYVAVPGNAGVAASPGSKLMIVAAPMTVTALYASTATSQPSGGAGLVWTVQKNGVNTTVTCTIPAGSGAATCSDTVHTASFTAGDQLVIRVDNGATAGSAQLGAYSMRVQ